MVALRHLAIAFEEIDTLPRRGRGHLRHAALLAPYVAARALAAGDLRTHREAARIGRRLETVRGPVLDEILLDAERPHSLAIFVAVALDTVEAVARARADPGGGREEAARAALDALEDLQPGLTWTRRLRELLDAPR